MTGLERGPSSDGESANWIPPELADDMLDIDERVVAKMKTGDVVELTYGTLVDAEDSGGCWFGFFNDDGEEVFNEDIEVIKPIAEAVSVPEASS